MAQERKKAIALRYEAGKDKAPVIVAKGKGSVADRIIKLAEDNRVPIVRDRELVEAMMNIEVFEEIPPVLYEAIAKVLVFVKSIKD
jgi:flagellar biosynthesis protein